MKKALILALTIFAIGCGSEEEPKYKFAQKPIDPNLVEDGIHVLTGLKAEEGYKEVVR